MDTQPEAHHVTVEWYRRMKTAIIILTVLSSILTISVIQLIRSNLAKNEQIEEMYSRHPDERGIEILRHAKPL